MQSHPLLSVLATILAGLLAFALVAGNPLDVLAGGLIIDTDYANAAAAFEIYVKDSWHWPLGASPHFGGVNIFFSDGAPWLALLSKTVYQLSGLFINFHWLIIINILAFAWMARRLAGLVTTHAPTQWLIMFCSLFSLIMPVRMIGAQHIALSSYWVVLWAMCCVPLDNAPVSYLRRWEFVATVSFAILSHAYLGAMAITLVCALLLSEKRWGATLLALLVPVLLMYVVGVFHGGHATTEGAKAYSADILVFTESLGWALLPNLYPIQDPTQSDAIMYLGTGIWWLVLACLVAKITMKRSDITSTGGRKSGLKERFRDAWGAQKRLTVLMLAGCALAIYSLSFNLRVAGYVVASMDIPLIFEPLYERFRVAGRFAAPLAYCLILLVCLQWGRISQRLPRVVALSVAGVAIALQIADVQFAGTKSPPIDWLADANAQRAAVVSVVEEGQWSGRVYREVGYFDLEQQRMIDRALVDQGAWHFEVAHGARLNPDEVRKRSGFAKASSGDLVITLTEATHQPACRKSVTLKDYTLCLLK